MKHQKGKSLVMVIAGETVAEDINTQPAMVSSSPCYVPALFNFIFSATPIRTVIFIYFFPAAGRSVRCT